MNEKTRKEYQFLADDLLPKLAMQKHLKAVAAEIEAQLTEALPNWTKAKALLKELPEDDYLADQAFGEIAGRAMHVLFRRRALCFKS